MKKAKESDLTQMEIAALIDEIDKAKAITVNKRDYKLVLEHVKDVHGDTAPFTIKLTRLIKQYNDELLEESYEQTLGPR